ncbi:response regulator [Paenibacillus sp. CF384]|uniref:response regulator transcription factor n=1 Tax=Paenibacillus sp. CF384 TaxID=1884382 RepID=UPI0008990605|nr:response regulator [Paenibacillus sp. CF384]SDX99585.1 Helix-turn-helix domain-containing protein [Paenibacillus sp. CF384]
MLKAVVFDDEYIVIEALRTLIDWTGLAVELVGTAGDGISALELFRRVKPDIVLTDIRMPGMDGLQLIQEIMREAEDTCCIVFSGFNEFEYVKQAIQLGVTDYLEKPITDESVERSLHKAVSRITSQRETKDIRRKWEESQRELVEKANLDGQTLGDDQAPKNSAVERARTYIVQHVNRDLSLQEVAEHVGMNAAYLSVLFKEETGETYIKFLTRYRMELAKMLLRRGLKVNEVSERVGYHTYRHFSEVFKKCTGTTPGQYREMI